MININNLLDKPKFLIIFIINFQTLSSCYYSCLDKTYDSLKPLLDIQCDINIELYCRGDTQLVFQIFVNNGNNKNITNNTNNKEMLKKKFKRNMDENRQRNYKEMSVNQQLINDNQEDNSISDDELTDLCRKSVKLIKVQSTNQIIGDTLVYMVS